MPPKVCQVVNAHGLIRAGKDDDMRGIDQSAHWTSPTPFAGSNLNIIQLFWRHLNRLNQGYNYASQSIWGSQCAGINPGGESAGSRAIERPKPSISPIAFAGSNLRIFPLFLKRWSRIDRLYNWCHRKYRARERLVGVRGRWRIDVPRRSPPGWLRASPVLLVCRVVNAHSSFYLQSSINILYKPYMLLLTLL